MAKEAGTTGGRGGVPWRIIGWGSAALLLLLPWIADAPWTASDFVFAAIMFGGVGLLFELTVRMSRNSAYRAGIGFALAATFVTIWVNAAVGMVGSQDNPLNIMFAGVIAIAFLGAVLARFRPERMARGMTVAAGAQLLASAVGAFTDLRGGILSAMFAGLWLLSAMLLGKAAREQRRREQP